MHQIWPVANSKEHFTNLVGSEHFFAMDFVKTEHRKRPNLPLQFPLTDRDRDMVDELNSRNVGQWIVHNLDYAISRIVRCSWS